MGNQSSTTFGSQKSLVRFIVPFRISVHKDSGKCFHAEKEHLNSYYLEENDRIINESSRHFDYIESFFTEKKDDLKLGKAYHFSSANHSKYHPIFSGITNNLSKMRVKEIGIVEFKESVLFFYVTYAHKLISKHNDYFDYLLDTKGKFKKTNIKKIISELFNVSEEYIEIFDSAQDLKRAKSTVRFLTYSEIEFENNLNVNKSIMDEVASYHIDRNSVQHSSNLMPSVKIKQIYKDGHVYLTEEGVSYLVMVNQDNQTIHTSTSYSIKQNIFFSYLLVLNQYYYLHHINNRIKKINIDLYEDSPDQKTSKFDNEKVKKLKSSLQKINIEYARFKTLFYNFHVSPFFYQMNIYKDLFEQYGIEKFCKEIDEATQPLYKLLEMIAMEEDKQRQIEDEIKRKKSDETAKKMNRYIQVLSSLTAGNVILVISKVILEMQGFKGTLTEKIIYYSILLSVIILLIHFWRKIFEKDKENK